MRLNTIRPERLFVMSDLMTSFVQLNLQVELSIYLRQQLIASGWLYPSASLSVTLKYSLNFSIVSTPFFSYLSKQGVNSVVVAVVSVVVAFSIIIWTSGSWFESEPSESSAPLPAPWIATPKLTFAENANWSGWGAASFVLWWMKLEYQKSVSWKMSQSRFNSL